MASREDLARFVGDLLRRYKDDNDLPYLAISEELSVGKPQVHSLINSEKGYGPKVELAVARRWFGGSVDALHAAAAAWIAAHPPPPKDVAADDDRASSELEEAIAEQELAPVVVQQCRMADAQLSKKPTKEGWRRYAQGIQREYEMLVERTESAAVRLPADLTHDQVNALLAQQRKSRAPQAAAPTKRIKGDSR